MFHQNGIVCKINLHLGQFAITSSSKVFVVCVIVKMVWKQHPGRGKQHPGRGEQLPLHKALSSFLNGGTEL
ncbi:hypothetical protein Lal_00032108 [Lupinus albus]|nr:hypothetical protein Lal_00032108 [Lupinus albus]